MDDSQKHRRDFLGSVRDALELLLLDTELLEEKFKYFYVVDFAAIYGYMYKKSQLPFLAIPGESTDRTFARHQVALHMLFNKYPQPLLLIPPYSTELKNQIRTLTTDAKLAKLDASVLYKEKLLRLIAESEDFQNFVLLRSGPSSHEVDEKLRNSALEIGKKHFPELYAAVACISVNGLETAQSLFRNDVLHDSDQSLPECSDIDYPATNADDWYVQIHRQRVDRQTRDPRRADTGAYQSWIDAMACTYVELANQRLNSQKKIIVFVSPSGDVERTLRRRLLISLPCRPELQVVRDLTYCLLASIHRKDEGNDKALIRQNLATVTSLFNIYDSPIPPDWRDDAKEIALEWESCQDLLLMRAPVIPESSLAKETPGGDADFLAVLEQLHRALTENQHGIAEDVEQKLSRLHDGAIELDKRINDDRMVQRFLSVKVRRNVAGVRITFPGLQDELGISLSFSGRDVSKLARRFEQLKAEKEPEAVRTLRAFVLADAAEPSATPEHHLLAGYILAAEGNYEAALSELNSGIKKSEDVGRRELIFLSAAIHRKLYHATEAIELLDKALQLEPEDPRVNLEYAKALWVRSREQPPVRTTNEWLERALEHLKIASDGTKNRRDRDLRAQVDNVAAFIQTELVVRAGAFESDRLEKARAHIVEMEMSVPEERWVGRFFDTRGYWYFAKAESLAADRGEEKKKLLECALRDLDKALESEEEIGRRLGVRREHRNLVIEALSRFAG